MTEIDLATAAHEHFSRIHRAAMVLSGNPWDADDLAQETFLVLSRTNMGQGGASFQARSALSTWLYGVLLNLDRRRRRRQATWRRKLQVLWSGDEARSGAEVRVDDPLEVEEWRRSLWAFVARLPDGQRQALVLRFSEHLSYDEVATVMGCPLGTVKSRIHHGLAALREMMQAQTGPADGDTLPFPGMPREERSHVV